VAAATLGRRIRPTAKQQLPLGVASSLLFHVVIFGFVLFSFHRNFTTPDETHIVPVDLVTIAAKTNIEAQSPPAPEAQKMDVPPPALEAPPEPQMQEIEPAPVPPMPQFDIAKEKPKPVD
jgi:outer membrane biosynthesis protein TonB